MMTVSCFYHRPQQQRQKIQQSLARLNKVASTVLKVDNANQQNTTSNKQETYLKGSTSVVVKNKDKVSALKKVNAPPHQREMPVRDQLSHPLPQKYGANFNSANPEADLVLQKIMLMNNCDYNRQYNTTNFTSDNISACGGLIFDQMQGESPRSTQSEHEESHRPAAANTSASDAASARSVDVTSMLRQIRRALGVREPCRADREAKKQQSEASSDQSASPKAEVETRRPSGAATRSAQAPQTFAAHAEGPSVSLAMAEQVTLNTSQKATLRSDAACVLSNWATHSGKPTLAKPNLNPGHKVRIAHEPSTSNWRKDARFKTTMSSLLTLSGAKKSLNVTEMYNEIQRRKRDKAKGSPRFGITFSKPAPTDQGTSAQPQDSDSSLSEGFHWESIPDNSSLSHMTSQFPLEELNSAAAAAAQTRAASTHAPAAIPSPAASTHPHAAYHAPAAAPDSHTVTKPSPQLPAPGAAQPSGTNLNAPTAHVKTEPIDEENSEGLRNDNNGLNKRKHNVSAVLFLLLFASSWTNSFSSSTNLLIY